MRFKFLLLTAGIFFSSIVSFAQFQASFSNSGNTLSFKIRPTVTVTERFALIEFYIRYPETSPTFTYGEIVENSTNFPGIGNFEMESLPAEGGYKIDHFFYTTPQPTTTAATYTSGTEYEVFSVKLIGTPTETVDLQIIQSTDDD